MRHGRPNGVCERLERRTVTATVSPWIASTGWRVLAMRVGCAEAVDFGSQLGTRPYLLDRGRRLALGVVEHVGAERRESWLGGVADVTFTVEALGDAADVEEVLDRA